MPSSLSLQKIHSPYYTDAGAHFVYKTETSFMVLIAVLDMFGLVCQTVNAGNF